MAGALVGGFAGLAAIPLKLLEKLEDGLKGREYIAALPTQLFERVNSP